MSPTKLAHSSVGAFSGAIVIIHQGLKAIKRDPQIMIYPYLAVLIILLTFPLANSLAHEIWSKTVPYTDLSLTDEAPHRLRVLLGLVTFYVFYTGLITSYFTCAVSASVLHKLEGQPTTPFYGLRMVSKRFFKVTKFACLAIFFFPLGIVAQRKKLNKPRGIVEVLGSSLSLHVGQLAPAILFQDKNVLETIHHSMGTLGKAWHQNLVIKLIMYGALAGLGFLSFLPKLVEHYWFDGSTSHVAGWVATALLGASSYIVVKVIGTVFTTTLYHKSSER
jgi:hypothetical protein